eukprot:TRINITY_DN5823_c0_g1_i2.p1 TRINITY_DN5823_c0_g1~~TRINITY_DN5823_c0_g1_i2.p1  ORF type:complete len:293 (-),score=94.77 TRINITY_DN5823_c0_g1_i2:228-1106(-)
MEYISMEFFRLLKPGGKMVLFGNMLANPIEKKLSQVFMKRMRCHYAVGFPSPAAMVVMYKAIDAPPSSHLFSKPQLEPLEALKSRDFSSWGPILLFILNIFIYAAACANLYLFWEFLGLPRRETSVGKVGPLHRMNVAFLAPSIVFMGYGSVESYLRIRRRYAAHNIFGLSGLIATHGKHLVVMSSAAFLWSSIWWFPTLFLDIYFGSNRVVPRILDLGISLTILAVIVSLGFYVRSWWLRRNPEFPDGKRSSILAQAEEGDGSHKLDPIPQRPRGFSKSSLARPPSILTVQ